MDPRSLHYVVQDLVRLSLYPPHEEEPCDFKVNTKRYATYFPSKASLDARWDASEDTDSTWEFYAPPSSRSSSSSSSSSATACSSPAQEIAHRYRAGLPLDLVERRFSASTTDPETVDDLAWEGDSISEYVSPIPAREVKAIFRQSRCDALLDVRDEAFGIMKACGLSEQDSLRCHRPGCRDTVRNVKALMYHLHIHNIDDSSYVCRTCDGRYETRRELTLHACRLRLKCTPVSPLRETFRRAFTKIACRC